MSVSIGINPLTWTNDDMPELGADTPLDVCLSEGKQAGYAGFELGQKFPRDPNVLASILKRHDLKLVSGWYSAELLTRDLEQEIAAVQAHLSLLKAMGCTVMVVAEVSGCIHGQRDVPLSQRPVMTEAQWQLFAERINDFGSYLQQQGIQLAYHHHMGTVVETEADIDRLMAMTNSLVGLLIDTGHLTYAGSDPLPVLKRHGSRVVHVHCKDLRPAVLASVKRADSSFLNAVLEGVFTVPGDGFIDYLLLAKELKSLNYSGWLVVEAEQDPAKANPLEYATRGYRHLESVVTASGL